MSDFLTRIANLTHGETTAVRARLPGQFAPLPDGQTAESRDDAPRVHGEYGEGLEPDDTRRQPEFGQAPVAPANRVNDPGTETGEPQTVDTKTAAHALGMIKVESEDEVIPDRTPAGMPLSPETHEKPAARDTLVGAEWEAPDFDYRGHVEIPTGRLQPGNEGERVAPQENVRAALPSSSPVHPKLLVQVQAPGREETGLSDLPGLPDRPQRAQSEPAVHIHIGRIEVRASTPAPRPQPGPAPARQQSSLSLQDYLARGQTGGKRS